MMVTMMILLIRMMTRCHLVISWLGSSLISAVVVQQALLYEVTVKKKRLFFPKLNHLLFSSFLQGAQNLEYHGACRLAEFPRPHEGEIQKKYGGGAEKIYITNYCSQGDEKFSYFRQFQARVISQLWYPTFSLNMPKRRSIVKIL